MDKEIKNAGQYPKIFYARHMQDGLAGYASETILVDNDTVKAMMPTFAGKPLYVHHVSKEDHKENLKEDSHGYVLETFISPLDNWVWSKFLAVDDLAFTAINNGWGVSNAYIPLEWGSGGSHNGCDYDRKITAGEFTHLALVPNPRYEESIVLGEEEYKKYCETKKAQLSELQNSKDQKKGSVMKLFKREKKEVSVIDADTLIEIKNDDGTTSEVAIQEMIKELTNAKKNEADKDEEKVNMDMEVDVDGEKMTVAELSNRYSTMQTKKNAADEDEKENKEEDEKDNADDKDAEDEKENEDDKKEEKKNSHFEELQNAGNGNTKPYKPYLKIDGLAVGKAKY